MSDNVESPCRCAKGAYLGAQLAGTPLRCERCRGLVDDEAGALLDSLYAASLERLEAWAAANPLRP